MLTQFRGHRRNKGRPQKDAGGHKILAKHRRLLEAGSLQRGGQPFVEHVFKVDADSFTSLKPKTLDNIQTSWEHFAKWAEAAGVQPVATEENLNAFLLYHARDPKGIVQRSTSIHVGSSYLSRPDDAFEAHDSA